MSRIQQVITRLGAKYTRWGGQAYTINEPTTILNHSLQTAIYMRDRFDPSPTAVVTALLHDYGHIAYCGHANPPINPDTGIDDKHELIGARVLTQMGFPPEVTEPIRLHVQAKRYLVTVDPGYKLSHGSVLSFHLQGGKMTEQEIEKFRQHPFAFSACYLRLADDLSKPIRPSRYRDNETFEDFASYLEEVLVPSGTTADKGRHNKHD